MRAIELVEMELGHAISWGFDARRKTGSSS
jgi:hypothetical protein